MSNGYVTCNKCGSQVPTQASFCTKCGNRMTPAVSLEQPEQKFNPPQQPAPNYYTQQPVQNQQFNAPAVPVIEENGKKKKSKRAVLGSVFGVIGAIIIGVTVRFATNKITTDVVNKLDIDNYVETVNSYEAGVVDGNSYSSDYFAFDIYPDENWVVDHEMICDYTGEDLQNMKDDKRSSLEQQDINESQIQTILDNFYYSTEYYADYYNEYGEITCSTNIIVLSDAGADNSGLDEIIELNKTDLSSQGIYATTSKTELAGRKVGLLEYTVENFGDYNYIKQYIGFEGDMTFCITTIYSLGNEDVADSFIDSISAY